MCSSRSRAAARLLALAALPLLQPLGLRAAEPEPPARRASKVLGGPDAARPAPETRTREQIFMDVFRHRPPAMPVSGYVLVSVDGAQARKMRAVISPDAAALKIEADAALQLLGTKLVPERLEALRKQVDAEGWLPRGALEGAGVATTFDERRFALALAIDPRLRGTTVKYLSAAPPDLGSGLRPARVSAFANVNVKGSEREESAGGAHWHRQDVAAAVNGAVNVGSLVLEGSGYGRMGDGRDQWRRGDARLVYDQPDQLLRYSAGDLLYPVVGYQTIVQMGGVGVSTDYSLQPYRRSFQTGQFEFYLERPATVRVWVNDSNVATLQLPAGQHDIRGLSPVVGLNNTRLVIEEASGRVQTIDFSFIYNPLLLEAGASLWSLNAGYRRHVRDGRYHYREDEPVFSGSYLRGVRPGTTLGLYAQADRSRSVTGLQAVQGVGPGIVQLDAAMRTTDGASTGFAGRAIWSYQGAPGPAPAAQGQVGVEYLGADFGNVNEPTPSRRDRVNVFGSLWVPLDAFNSVQFAGYYTAPRNALDRSYHSASVGWTRRWGPAALTLGLRHRRTRGGDDDHGVFVGLTYTFSNGVHNVYAGKEAETDAGTASWSTTLPSTESGPYGFASTRVGGGTREYRGGAGYWTHQGLAEASHSRSQVDSYGTRFVREESAVRLQSALVFADGAFGLTPQVTQNFAIVRGKLGLAGKDMKLDPTGEDGSRGRSSWLSPAVVTDVPSYQLRRMRVEPLDAPVGATPEKLQYALAATYKSGFLLELGKETRVVAVGRLVDAKGEPVVHVPLEARRMGDAAAEPVRTFTSRTGSFQLPDLRPGRYEVTPAGPLPWNTVILDIADAPEGLVRLGNIAVSR